MKTIRAGNFYEYVKCPRKVYLHFFGDASKKVPFSEFMLEKMKQGRDYETEVASHLKFVQPDKDVSQEEAFKQTVEFMKKGEDLIYQGFLLHKNLVGIPDFLEKKKGKSKLGDWYYEAMDVKSGLSAKPEYLMQVCFYSYLLEQVQGVFPEKFKLYFGNGKQEVLETKNYVARFASMFEKIKDIARGKEEPVHIASACKECPWEEFCFAVAEKANDLSLIYNISRTNVDALKEKGIMNLKDAAKMDTDEIAEIKGIGEKSAKKWQLQAQSLIDNKSIRIVDHEFSDDKSIYFDIEDTEVNGEKVVYLFGLIENGKFIDYTAKKPDEAAEAWLGFLNHFKDRENFKVYVYSGHEKMMMKKLFEKFGGNEQVYNKIVENIVDLLPIVKQTAVFPIYSYSIKNVAKFLGFKWSAEDASGAQSMIWYDKWLETGDEKHLKEVLRYNKEDCKAMAVVKEWIEKG